MGAVNALVTGGYAPLTAMVLAARGIKNAADANAFLSCNCAMPDPYLMKDMEKDTRDALHYAFRILVRSSWKVLSEEWQQETEQKMRRTLLFQGQQKRSPVP